MKATMKYPVDTVIGFFSGITGGSFYVMLADITWHSIMNDAGNLLWLAFVAMITGAAGVLGKHLVSKYLKRKK